MREISNEDNTVKTTQEGNVYSHADSYKALFYNCNEAFAHAKTITDETGKPIDWIYIDVNPAFEKITGLKGEDVIGRKITEILPTIVDDPADWIGRYGKVALTGEETFIEDYSQPMGRWYVVHVFCPKIGEFGATFSDVTERKEMEIQKQELMESLKRSNEQLKEAFSRIQTLEGILPICANCHKLRTEDGKPENPDDWVPIELYLEERTKASFSHGICPDCMKELYPDLI